MIVMVVHYKLCYHILISLGENWAFKAKIIMYCGVYETCRSKIHDESTKGRMEERKTFLCFHKQGCGTWSDRLF